MAVEEEFYWGNTISSTDTFADRIGAIEDVEFADMEKAFTAAWEADVDRMDVVAMASGDTNTNRLNHIREYIRALASLGPALAAGMGDALYYNGDNYKDYIIAYCWINLDVLAYPSGIGSNNNQSIKIYLIHKEDFINLCGKWNEHIDYASTNTTNNSFTFNDYGASGGMLNYTLLHNHYSLSDALLLNFNGTNHQELRNQIANDINIKSSGSQYEVRVLMPYISIGHVQSNFSYIYGTNSAAGVSSSSGQYFGAYGSSTKTFGQPDAEPGGEDGEQENHSDNIDVPPLPTIGLYETNFGKIYMPTLVQIKLLADYLWDADNIFVDFYRDLEKKFTHPIDAVLGLFVSNINPPSEALGNTEFKVGGKRFLVDGNPVLVQTVLDQYVEIDCGTILIKKYWGNFLDYNPYTSIDLFLPFIGNVSIDTDEFMGKQMNIKYHFDLGTGACQAYISLIDGDYHAIKYIENGNCFMQLPVTQGNYQEVIATILKCAAAGAAVGVAAGSVAAIGSAAGGISSMADLNAAKTLAKSAGAGLSLSGADAAKGLAVGAGAGLVGASAAATKGSKDRVQKAGAVGQALPLFCPKTPYITISRPNQSFPKNYAHFKGRPSNITSKLSSLSGYTEVEFVRIENISATDDEKQLIQRALTSGVIL